MVMIYCFFLFLPAVVLSIKASFNSFIGSISSRYLCSNSSYLTISSSCSGLMVLGGRTPEPVGELLDTLPLDDPCRESPFSEDTRVSLMRSMILGTLVLESFKVG
jgi:hypothetical protein